MTKYTYSVDKEEATTWRTYVAKITGTHPLYILKRRFEDLDIRRSRDGFFCSVSLPSGLYEASIIRYDKDTKERVSRHRWWIVVAEEDVYEYEFEEMNWQYALFTAYNIKVNFGVLS